MSSWRHDLHAARDRDPAARSLLEVALLYPGVHAIWAHRVAHWLWLRDQRFAGRAVSQMARKFTGIEIHPGAKLGSGLFIDHGMGVVIGETAVVGDDVTIYHGVTLGGTTLDRGHKRHPTIGDRVVIGAGAKVLGAITVGADSRIGANSVVVRPVPPKSVVVGVPGQIVSRSRVNIAVSEPDLDEAVLPDLVGASLSSLLDRVDELETAISGSPSASAAHRSPDGVWSGLDFSI
ncbi:MAG: serine O-acetyltransferase [Actinobacteria bacterium]|jgi:serine O-acetyltransferase|uniref:Serine acetyltransferase n=1 Tax=freshwater metagenome TaxID=449393 RepID=A0A6J7C6T4_9ZZZZ|nr:serine O-acetyltransferase [Actinomycetota bacterium]MSW77689.1 serine O-acetyltransferase [Actinomycetota bacterium]MSX56058.1 serine O-acetyltransferase [Actinomycetota bacterium]MSX94243.1 serine O-acetyltransferase [Actinomycetota bacterium]MSZ81703.1 serine O-acetyltransferase [Actinomycetota bacterium]